MFQGNISWKNGDKSAKIIVPIIGPKREGKLFIDATGNGDTWIYHEIRVEVNDAQFDYLETQSDF